jgi:murein DD-endopeptidase MepM/ murein hydrolase activator NlpD
MTAVFGGLFGLATVTSAFALLIQVFPVKGQRDGLDMATPAAASASSDAASASERPRRGPVKRIRQELPQPWRVEDLRSTHLVVKGEMQRRSLSAALDDEHVPKDQVYRILKAFEGVYKFDRPKRRDAYVVAMERGSKKIVGFEYAVSPTEIYQARQSDAGLLEAKQLDLQVKAEEFATAFYIGKSFTKSYESAGLETGLVKALNDAFNGQTSTEAFQEGGVLKAVLVETTALGRFAGYERTKAVEYRPPDPARPPLRAYWFEGEAVKSYVDDKGRHSSNAGWRTPVPGAPITSHFNPKRMHPVLHTVMPHNGTDYGAPSGTPVYAAFRGKVSFIGPQGPSGNLVLIEHPNGVQTGYAHLSRFAEGVKVGDAVGTRQLVGYVGSTGRSTGPHLHFSAKRDGRFFDAMDLKMDSLQLLPASERATFAEQKARYDGALDAIPMPEPPEPDVAEAPPAPKDQATAEESAPAAEGDAARIEAAKPAASGEAGGEKPSNQEGPALLGEDLSGDIE